MAFCERKKTTYGSGEPLMGYRIDLLEGSWAIVLMSVLKKLMSRVDTGTCSFITDEWGGFFRLLPTEHHFYGKDLTFPIEATRSDIRHSLSRCHRRSKISSRSPEMVEVSLLLFHRLPSPQTLESLLESLLNPLLSFFS